MTTKGPLLFPTHIIPGIISSIILALSIFSSVYFYSQSVRYELRGMFRIDRKTGQVWQWKNTKEGTFMFKIREYPEAPTP
jgi:hypothetical protein